MHKIVLTIIILICAASAQEVDSDTLTEVEIDSLRTILIAKIDSMRTVSGHPDYPEDPNPPQIPIDTMIIRFESYYDESCSDSANFRRSYSRCRQAFFELNTLYRERFQIDYIKAHEQWIKDSVGIEPVADYSALLPRYLEAMEQFPDWRTLDETYFLTAKVYIDLEQYDTALVVFDRLIENYDDSYRSEIALFYSGEIEYEQFENPQRALRFFQRIDRNNVNPSVLMHGDYRIVQCEYELGYYRDASESAVHWLQNLENGGVYPRDTYRADEVEQLLISSIVQNSNRGRQVRRNLELLESLDNREPLIREIADSVYAFDNSLGIRYLKQVLEWERAAIER